MKVGIIGSGVGGACLAHGLRKNGIKVKVYERSASTLSMPPGYGIYVNTFGQQAMQECLPEANWRAFTKMSKSVGGQIRFYDEHLHLLLATQSDIRQEDGQLTSENRMLINRSDLYANEAVEIPLRTTLNTTNSSTIKRILFRTTLRVAQTLPPVKRRLFPSAKYVQHQGKIKLGTTKFFSSTQ
ncbi:NAD(P)-binding protein [Photorhabdus asymbiotica]|uniref:NAD(P)-binding protein n=1 Tax=Photorhabdus asymbiotica TaxID=291112 RepID=UPI003DA6FDA6